MPSQFTIIRLIRPKKLEGKTNRMDWDSESLGMNQICRNMLLSYVWRTRNSTPSCHLIPTMLSGSFMTHCILDYDNLRSKLHLKSQLGFVSKKKLNQFSSSSFDFGRPLVSILPNSPFAKNPIISHSLR